MSTVINEQLKNFLLNGFPEDVESPIQSENGCTYMMFDQIKQSNMTDDLGGIKVEFFWRGRLTHWMMAYGIQFKDDSSITLSGIEGRQQFDIKYGSD